MKQFNAIYIPLFLIEITIINHCRSATMISGVNVSTAFTDAKDDYPELFEGISIEEEIELPSKESF